MLKVATTVAVLLLFLVALELGFRRSELDRRLAAEEGFTSIVSHYLKTPKTPEVVVIGDSRAFHGVDTRVIERLVKRHALRSMVSWVMARGGVIGQTMLAFTLRVLERPERPRLVIFFVEPNSFILETSPELARKVLTKAWRLVDLPAVARAGAGAEELLEIGVGATLDTMRYRERLLEVKLHDKRLHKPQGPATHGFRPYKPANGDKQHKRALRRAAKFLDAFDGPRVGYRLSEFKLGGLREAVRLLEEAGVKVVLVNSPTTSVVRTALARGQTIVPRYLEAMRALAGKLHARFLDHSAPPQISDDNYVDGDHLDAIGAARYTTWLTHEVILPVAYGVRPRFDRWDVPRPSAGCAIVFDFEERRARGWDRRGDAFTELLAGGRRGLQKKVEGAKGLGLLSSWDRRTGARATGEATSPLFTIAKRRLRFLLGGGTNGVSVDLVVDGATARTKGGPGGDKLSRAEWDVSDLAGRTARLRVVDAARDASGYVLLDQVEQCDR
jgi:hypothetical protein